MTKQLMPPNQGQSDFAAELRRQAEDRLRARKKGRPARVGDPKGDVEALRVPHELEVHQIELEMQNAELRKTRNDLEAALESYTDLYDFAPVGYFSVDESGVVLESNLTGAELLGVERSRLVNRRLLVFVAPSSRTGMLGFLKQMFAEGGSHFHEAEMAREGGSSLWVGIRGAAAASTKGKRRWCRLAFGDITARREAEEARRKVAALAETNQGLEREIARRKKVEKALKRSEERQGELLEEARAMQAELRGLSRNILRAQEEERKRISRELHDQVTQTLVGINVHLEGLVRGAEVNARGLKRRVARTQALVARAVETVHEFARDLRPTALDDLGLIPALHGFMKEFTKRTGVRARLTAFAAIEKLSIAKRTAFYRVAHEALCNVGKHAEASEAEVRIERLPDRVRMTIRDDGKSFDTGKRGKRLGLIGMRERIELAGGSFAMESAPGKGTTVTAELPLGAGLMK